MKSRLRLLGLTALACLFIAALAGAQDGETNWETVVTDNRAMNSGWMELDAVDRENVFVAGLHQNGAMSAQYAWASSDGGDTWQNIYEIEIDPTGDECDMMDIMGFIFGVAFTSADHGIITGMGVPEECKELGMPACMFVCMFQMKAKILYTHDGGDSWAEAIVPGNSLFVALLSALFVDGQVGYAAGAPAYVAKTTDGGFTWTQMETPGGDEELGINQMHFVDHNLGFMATGDLDPEEGTSAATGGETMMEAMVRARHAGDYDEFQSLLAEYTDFQKNPITRLEHFKEHNGGKGINGIVYKTEDGGVSWEPILNNNDESYLKVQFLDENHGWVLASPADGTATSPFRLYRTEDGGEEWEKVETDADIPGVTVWQASDIHFTSPEIGWMVGAGQGLAFYKSIVFYTEDGGKTWEADPFCQGNNRYPMLAVDFTDSKTGFSVGMYNSAARYVGPNSVPIADAGEDQTVPVNTLVQLDGSESYDPDGDPLQYIWSQPGGEPMLLDDSTIVTPAFSATTVGELTFELIVTDGEATSAPDQVVITVTDDGEGDDDDDEGDDDDDSSADRAGGCGGCSIY